MREIAIVGATASGKSSLAVEIAQKVGANILSLDSLSLYKEIDIASAKPTIEERGGVRHFGIDEIYIDDYFSVSTFFEIYKRAKDISIKEGKHLIITGGTSFYLKSMIDGLSQKLERSSDTKDMVLDKLSNLAEAYSDIKSKDLEYANKIEPTDSYRIGKWFEIYFESGMVATDYFLKHQKEPIIKDIDIFEISIDRKSLRDRISLRTSMMIKEGLVEEVFGLEKRYTRVPNPMKAIGVVETLAYLDGKITVEELHNQISTHTAQLAKRQETFNRSQFPNICSYINKDLKNKLLSYF